MTSDLADALELNSTASRSDSASGGAQLPTCTCKAYGAIELQGLDEVGREEADGAIELAVPPAAGVLRQHRDHIRLGKRELRGLLG
eukprot:CAMPEP_0196668244 /NCGR_PEP_ID=MMETSP1086-20130531/65516_1 /TAXON_ID=77921 /ORGANISM="Cyanoptyche  gloeocystis , Strain SAG4.97" /LENGTH=85 /DNA_ID=CAMNT_0042005635 /DNA_START=791 /DNA_END=1045 /DNA_ORIENTATION=+